MLMLRLLTPLPVFLLFRFFRLFRSLRVMATLSSCCRAVRVRQARFERPRVYSGWGIVAACSAVPRKRHLNSFVTNSIARNE
jgi:hypothetical protein